MEYQYIATTRHGQTERGFIEASSKEGAISQLRQRQLLIISVHCQEKKEGLINRSNLALFGFSRVSLLDKVIFARQLSIMIRSGLSLAESLNVLADQTASKKMKSVIKKVLQDVTNGLALSAGLARFPRIFTGIFIGMVRVGESSGTLERNFEYLANELEKDYELRRKVKSAMLYPMIVLTATFLLGIGLTIFILPKLVIMFRTFRMELPVVTKIFLGIANALVDYGILIIIGIAALVIAARVLAGLKATKPFFHKLILGWPVFGKLSKSMNLARLSRILAILLKSGVTINDGLVITAETVDNVCYKKEIEKALDGVKKGQSLAAVWVNEDYLPKMANKIIDTGEKTGKLEESLFYLADFYEREVNNATKTLATVIEPILLIVIGVALGFLAVAIISPIYQFTGSLQR